MNYRIRTILSIAFFLVMSVVVAQSPKTIKKELKVCDTNTRPFSLGERVVGIKLTPRGGSWAEVDPTDTSYNTVIKEGVSNVFVAIDRQPGVYAFVYTAKNNYCMENGDRAVAIVEIVETPKPVHINIVLCPGDTKNINLNDYISSTLKAKYPNGIVYEDSNGIALANGVLPISSTFEGTTTASYKINELRSNCNAEATISLNVVRSKEDISSKDLVGEKMFCISALPSSINLNNELGLAGNGTWTAEGTALAVNNGVVDLSGATEGTHKYKFTFDSSNSCIATGTEANYTLTILKDMTTVIKSEGKLDICKIRNPERKIALQSILNISIPIKAGEWSPNAGNPPNAVDVSDGYFEVANAPEGTYTYTYRISNALDLCGLVNKEATVKIIIENGGRLFDGEVQICSTNVPTSLDLSTYVAGVEKAKTTWYEFDGTTEISTGSIDPSKLKVGTHKYVYKTGSTECKSEGTLYVTIQDRLTNFTNKEVAYCLTDFGADAINLKEILGVAGVPGTWTSSVTGVNYDTTTQIFNGKAEAEKTGVYPQSFTFTFTADSTAGCGLAGETATITVKITDTLIP